jgi:2-polyprenyl-6-hydroxyphenyl methylase / 3-demethylubiquinone-9 3-methyltransferase
MSDSLALHSGDYVARYNAKSIDRVAALVRRIPIRPDSHIADFGCGNGMLLQALEGPYGSYDGVDFSQDFIDSAEQWARQTRRRDYTFHCADIRDFCASRTGQFDIAATLDFSEHIDDALAVELYGAIRTSLRPGGRLYLHTPNLDFVVERAKDLGIMAQFPEHIAVRNGPQMAQVLTRAGFAREAISVQTIAHYNVLKALHPLSHLPAVGRLFAARLWIEAAA